MELIITALATGLAISLTKILEKTSETALEPLGEVWKNWLQKDYNENKARETLRQTIMGALDDVRATLPNAVDRFALVWKLTGQSAEVYDLLAASAVEMITVEPRRIPAKLAQALNIIDADREMFAGFLFALRKQLAKAEGFEKLIAYTNDLDRRGLLEGLSKKVEALIDEAKQFKSYLEIIAAECHLTNKDELALEKYLDMGRTEWSGLALNPRSRAAAADVLDELGYVSEDLYEFVPIEQNGILSYFAKYPVTNAQYQRFLEAEDFHAEKYWVNFPNGRWEFHGYQWLKQSWDENKKVLPRFWSDPRFGNNRRHAPVVGISWHEANAYCSWLLAHWTELDESKQGLPKPKEIRLPKEEEWVRAAGGESSSPAGGRQGEGDRFAWGTLKNAKDIVHFANTAESGINRTTLVWMYLKGQSDPYKLMDVSGNVFEWQMDATDYDGDGYEAEYLGEYYMSLRGGAWSRNGGDARVSFHLIDHPYVRLSNLGFRVVFFSG